MSLRKLFQALGRRQREIPVPPQHLRDRVQVTQSPERFLEVSNVFRADLEAALQRVGLGLAWFSRILDFGCGCGRALRAFADLSRSARLFGTDIDAEAIEWCRANLRFASFRVNSASPPLPFPPAKFDLVFSISVFTHIDEERQFEWLQELRRVMKPGGLALITLHGSLDAAKLPADKQAVLNSKGIYFDADGAWKDIFPDWYQSTFHTEEYVRRQYADFFEVLDYIPMGLNDHQDIAVLRKPRRDKTR